MGVGNLGGGIAFDLPLLLRTELIASARFSLSEEKDAAGEGDSEATFDMRPCSRRVESASYCVRSVSPFSTAGEESRARRAIVFVNVLGDAQGDALGETVSFV